MNDQPLTAAQREYLAYYVATKHQRITPLFVFHFYIWRIRRWGVITVVAVLLALLVPSTSMISLRTALIALPIIVYLSWITLSAWTSFASVENWELLKRLFDWDKVESLNNSSES